MRRIVDACAILLDPDFTLELAGHTIEFGDHRFDLRNPAPLLVELKLLEPN
jgi:hypothetical protein